MDRFCCNEKRSRRAGDISMLSGHGKCITIRRGVYLTYLQQWSFTVPCASGIPPGSTFHASEFFSLYYSEPAQASTIRFRSPYRSVFTMFILFVSSYSTYLYWQCDRFLIITTISRVIIENISDGIIINGGLCIQSG